MANGKGKIRGLIRIGPCQRSLPGWLPQIAPTPDKLLCGEDCFMPIWSEILDELRLTAQENQGEPDFDRVRRKYLFELHEHSGRNTILYASAWLQKGEMGAALSIHDEDIHALMEVIQGLEGPDLDLILHSPGGSPEAAEAIVSYLRTRFSHIRVIVPQLAMSAAAMIACAADEIVLGKHSSLGPIDPQIVLPTSLGVRLVPAQAILDQFDRAQRECVDSAKLAAWLPMLSQYGPDLLEQCEKASQMSRDLVKVWLETYMFKEDAESPGKAKEVSNWLADHKHFKSHNRHISRETLEDRQLKIAHLEEDEKLQDLSLSVFHATVHTFTGTPTVKIVENHCGRAYIKQSVPVAPVSAPPQG